MGVLTFLLMGVLTFRLSFSDFPSDFPCSILTFPIAICPRTWDQGKKLRNPAISTLAPNSSIV